MEASVVRFEARQTGWLDSLRLVPSRRLESAKPTEYHSLEARTTRPLDQRHAGDLDEYAALVVDESRSVTQNVTHDAHKTRTRVR